MADYYSILGLSKGASDAEIKSAYRKKALEYHPDRNKAADATAKFKEVTKAYETLSNPEKKNLYDQVGHDNFERSGGRAGGGAGAAGWGGQQGGYTYSYGGQNVNFDFGGADPFDIFEQFFGGGRRQPRKPLYEMQLTFEEAMRGVEKNTVIEGKQKSIKIPAGVDTGTRVRFTDFDVQVRVKPHQFFHREGQDIYLEKNISYSQAVLGTVLEVPTIAEPVKIKVRPGTQPGTHIRLRGQGVPYPNSHQRGDQYVILKIHIPERVSGTAKKLLEQLDNEL